MRKIRFQQHHFYMLCFCLLFLSFSLKLILTAWICDDAAITLRTVLNFLNGYGPTFNMAERVQAYTHPLWFLLLSFFSYFSGNVFYTTFALSIFVSLLTLMLFFTYVAKKSLWGILMGMVLVVSTAYIDFSTSGLENPLTHLLLVGYVIAYKHYFKSKLDVSYQELVFMTAITSALYLTRPDTILLILPSFIWLMVKAPVSRKTCLRAMIFGGSPVILWTVFSLFYYGFLFPNTAYAKLAADLPFVAKATKGLAYLKSAWQPTLLANITIVASLLVATVVSSLTRLISVGMLLYLIFLIFIGGDFMLGRMLTPALLCACMILSQIDSSQEQHTLIFATIYICILVALGSSYSAMYLTYGGRWITKDGFADERAYYFQSSGLWVSPSSKFQLAPEQRFGGGQYLVCGHIGYEAISAGLNTHFIDPCGLADPFLSKLPYNQDTFWRPGHLFRDIPLGYPESVKYGRNYIQDKKLKALYDQIRLITRGDLFNYQRLKAIIKMNFGVG